MNRRASKRLPLPRGRLSGLTGGVQQHSDAASTAIEPAYYRAVRAAHSRAAVRHERGPRRVWDRPLSRFGGPTPTPFPVAAPVSTLAAGPLVRPWSGWPRLSLLGGQ